MRPELLRRVRFFRDEPAIENEGAKRMDLLTGKDNYSGQGLYEKMGWYKTNEAFYAYSLDL